MTGRAPSTNSANKAVHHMPLPSHAQPAGQMTDPCRTAVTILVCTHKYSPCSCGLQTVHASMPCIRETPQSGSSLAQSTPSLVQQQKTATLSWDQHMPRHRKAEEAEQPHKLKGKNIAETKTHNTPASCWHRSRWTDLNAASAAWPGTGHAADAS